ncbi:MAG: D-tyrosyl-tRNA(Tyr) deacylase, partial [Megasphaera micronuciformis]|nr:D-tyrosyl-tRNA(Tyr) deacylase [Megasphaera micronuciformis]
MRAVIQRTIRSSVTSEGTETGRIGAGLTVLLGVGRDDDEKDVVYTADKILNLRIFEDEEGKMNQSLLQKGGEMLVVSQFTLYGDVRHGRRPSFTAAAPPDLANRLY